MCLYTELMMNINAATISVDLSIPAGAALMPPGRPLVQHTQSDNGFQVALQGESNSLEAKQVETTQSDAPHIGKDEQTQMPDNTGQDVIELPQKSDSNPISSPKTLPQDNAKADLSLMSQLLSALSIAETGVAQAMDIQAECQSRLDASLNPANDLTCEQENGGSTGELIPISLDSAGIAKIVQLTQTSETSVGADLAITPSEEGLSDAGVNEVPYDVKPHLTALNLAQNGLE